MNIYEQCKVQPGYEARSVGESGGRLGVLARRSGRSAVAPNYYSLSQSELRFDLELDLNILLTIG